MSDQFDDQIRAALRAEAEDVTADDALLARIRARSIAEAPALRHRAPWLLSAAAVAAVIVGAATLVLRDDDRHQTVDVADGPAPTDVDPDLLPAGSLCNGTSDVALVVVMAPGTADEDVRRTDSQIQQAAASSGVTGVAMRTVDAAGALAELEARYAEQPERLAALSRDTVFPYFILNLDGADVELRAEISDLPGVIGTTSETCSREPSSNTTSTVPPPGAGHPAPEHVLAVTEDGRLVLLRTADGAEVSELADLGSGEATEDNPAPTSITGVAVRPGTSEVYVETCCEPAAGHIFRVDLASPGAEPVSVAYGYGMDISGDGRRMAYVSGLTVSVMDIDSGEVISTAESGDGTHDWVQAALDHDGSVIAIERALERADDGVVVRSDARTTSLDDGAYEEHDVAAGRFMPIWVEGESLASAPAPGEHLRDANVDETGEWVLVVTEDGRLVARGGEGERVLADGPFLAADW